MLRGTDLDGLEVLEDLLREGSATELAHAEQTGIGADGHNAGKNGDLDACESTMRQVKLFDANVNRDVNSEVSKVNDSEADQWHGSPSRT